MQTITESLQDMKIHIFDEGNVALVHNLSRRPYIEVPKEKQFFNSYQWFLLQRCLKGLKVYDEEELRYFSKSKIKRIKHVHEHSLEVIRLYCQEVLIKITNSMLLKHFRCLNQWSVPKALVECSETDPDFKIELSFKDLGINPRQVAFRLVEKRCLPWNYFELTINDDPRLIKLRKPQQPIDEL